MEEKQKISKIIESLPESVLTYLRDIEMASKNGGLRAMHLRTILKEDYDLLEELAK